MIIQCEQCSTKFKLDDSKVSDKGVKVRCARCRHVFSVAKEQAETVPLSDFGSMLDTSVSSDQDVAELQPEFGSQEHVSEMEFEETAPAPDTASEPSGDTASDTFEMQVDQDAPFISDDSSVGQTFFSEEQDAPSTSDTGSVDQTIFFEDEESEITFDKTEPPETIGEIDFGAFTFGDDADDTATKEAAPIDFDFGDTPKIDPLQVAPQKEEFGGLDFSGDDLFGEVVAPPSEESADTISFDFGMDDFAASMGVDDTSVNQKNSFSMSDASSETPFSLDEIDFGDDLTSVGVQHVNPEELKPSQELLFAPLAEAQAKSVSDSDKNSTWKNPAGKDELPPLSIASRRKQSPIFTGLVVVLGIIITGVVAFFGYSMFSGDKTTTAHDAGRISLSEVDATFVKNKLTGDLLVISGEAINEFNKPRAAIQIKGMVYGADGQVVASKTAFCGNPLTEEQLSTMSLDKIEAAMANQFGDSLANMEVAPGKAIPFVIVIAKSPADAKDYGVEAAGSTVAAGRQ
jgi:predicted Zn finger-like uncharacterized protein